MLKLYAHIIKLIKTLLSNFLVFLMFFMKQVMIPLSTSFLNKPNFPQHSKAFFYYLNSFLLDIQNFFHHNLAESYL
jgi:hypothetical protein